MEWVQKILGKLIGYYSKEKNHMNILKVAWNTLHKIKCSHLISILNRDYFLYIKENLCQNILFNSKTT